MTDDDTGLDRRSVLKAAGTALGVGLGATGAAAATCSTIRLKNDYYLLEGSDYLTECVEDEATDILVEKGTEFTVYDFCDTNGDATGGEKYYQIYYFGTNVRGYYWVSDIHAECV